MDSSLNSFEHRLAVSVTDIGQPSARLHIHETHKENEERAVTVTGQAAVIQTMLDVLSEKITTQDITAIGHRIVHGGPNYSEPRRITDELEQELQSLASFDPEHMPIELELIRTLRERFLDVPQIACFDTSFFHDLPKVAQLMPLPRQYQAQGLRRYGFHGLSYEYLLSAFRDVAGDVAANGRVIFAHLGSGASLAATHSGKPIDTTMGFTPASGIVMSTRSGDIDPGVAWYLHKQAGMSVEAYNHMVNFESGLLGVSGLSADMLTLLNNEAANQHAAEAVDLFCYQAKKAIGGLVASLGGVDSLVFSGGIGEQAPRIRSRICSGLGFLGIELDENSNAQHLECISSLSSRVGVHVIPTDEAQIIGKQTVGVMNAEQTGGHGNGTI